jgi:hypothetical protein
VMVGVNVLVGVSVAVPVCVAVGVIVGVGVAAVLVNSRRTPVTNSCKLVSTALFFAALKRTWTLFAFAAVMDVRLVNVRSAGEALVGSATEGVPP